MNEVDSPVGSGRLRDMPFASLEFQHDLQERCRFGQRKGHGPPFLSFGNLDEGDGKGWRARKTALKISKSVVGLSSFTGEKKVFSCSGSIIGKNGATTTVLTSATLLKGFEDNLTSADRVEVHLPMHETIPGIVEYYDFYHNIAIVTLQYDGDAVTAVSLTKDSKLLNQGRDVIALGRHPETHGIMAYHGEINMIANIIESEDVLSSSVILTRYGIGGPLIDFESGDILGMNFLGYKATPFLPSIIVLKCLDHFKNHGMVIRPFLGLKTIPIDTLMIDRPERICQNFPNMRGVYVEKVIDGSPAHTAGISAGDIITELEKNPIKSHVEFVSVLLDEDKKFVHLKSDEASAYMSKQREVSVEVLIMSNSSGRMEPRVMIVQDLSRAGKENRWRLPTRSPHIRLIPWSKWYD